MSAEKGGGIEIDAFFFDRSGTLDAVSVGIFFDALEGPFDPFELYVAAAILFERHGLLLHTVHAGEASDARLIQFDGRDTFCCGILLCEQVFAQCFEAFACLAQFDFVRVNGRR